MKAEGARYYFYSTFYFALGADDQQQKGRC